MKRLFSPKDSLVDMPKLAPKNLDLFTVESDSLTSDSYMLVDEQENDLVSVPSTSEQAKELSEIESLDALLLDQFRDKVRREPLLTRQIVSFQANKTRASYRWYKYKEAFSASLVEYLLDKYALHTGKLLDPFAGSGTALFAASSQGMGADGIELLPIGQQIIATKLTIERDFTEEDLATLKRWISGCPWQRAEAKQPLSTLRITNGAYPTETLDSLERYMAAWSCESEQVQAVLRFALLCILESISYTRKDGQYLRWDYRSGRKQGNRPFNKGAILSFDEAICLKLAQIIDDAEGEQSLVLFQPQRVCQHDVTVLLGSCLDIMPAMPASSYDAILTSPPYCNRYDYTRTYALELALLGIGETNLISLRQQMLSCTVENRAKDLMTINPAWETAIRAADNQPLLQTILRYLDAEKQRGNLNNSGIPRMVRGYFYELACVIADCARVLKTDAPLFMVNDNVRYSGASISVDLILSSIAEQLGFRVENILVLPTGKGNSSQQMGEHGRESLRKCVYVWRKN